MRGCNVGRWRRNALSGATVATCVAGSSVGFAESEPSPMAVPLAEREAADELEGAAELAAAGGDEPNCASVSFAVVLDESSPDTYSLVGELCRPARGRVRTLQILLHGASFNRSYWDFPFRSRRYSYVGHANAAGFATLAIDRLGTGESDRPPPELVTVHASASTIHQVVSAIRSGEHRDAGGWRLRFDRIVLVGNSFGSNISWTEAGTYADVDGLILTAISHDPNPPAAPLTQLYAYPAQLDPLFAGLGLPSGYLTTLPGARTELFFHLPGASEAVIAVDETLKDTLPVGMLFDQFTTYGLTQNIHVPVLNVVGDFDTLSCQLPSCTESGSIADEGSNTRQMPATRSSSSRARPTRSTCTATRRSGIAAHNAG
jgi:pimeloyl-ACP methyl ester carboxylesterase